MRMRCVGRNGAIRSNIIQAERGMGNARKRKGFNKFWLLPEQKDEWSEVSWKAWG